MNRYMLAIAIAALVSAPTLAAIVGRAPSSRCIAKIWPIPRTTALDPRSAVMYRYKAYQWDPDGRLIMVASRPKDFGLDGKSSRWGYRMVSGDGKRVVVFNLDLAHPNTPVRMSRNAKRPSYCPADINTTFWKIDSPDVWRIALPRGLQAWLDRHPAFDLHYSGNRFELVAETEEAPYWRVLCSAKSQAGGRKRDKLEFGVSATEGRLLYMRSRP